MCPFISSFSYSHDILLSLLYYFYYTDEKYFPAEKLWNAQTNNKIIKTHTQLCHLEMTTVSLLECVPVLETEWLRCTPLW